MTIIPGDPASLSSCGATVRMIAHRLETEAALLGSDYDALCDGWPGRVSATAGQRGVALADAADTTASELDQLGCVLQDHATDLADLIARARGIEERAASAGLEVRDGRVVPTWGVRGETDAASAHRQMRAAATLQADLDLILAQHRRRRDWALDALRGSTGRLGQVSHRLRRG
jgi:hypothetical protein